MVDRFANGNVTNDRLNIPDSQRKFGNSSSPYGLPSYRHGGDLQGIIRRLDYLKDLGVTTVWVTPVLINCGGEYHGYCPSDLTVLDPGFGDWGVYQLLLQEAHARGMYVVQDIVINHLCGCGTVYDPPTSNHASCASTLDGQFWGGGRVGDNATQGRLAFSDTFFPPLKSEFFFNRCGPNSGADTSGTGSAAVYGDFVTTMLDLATYNYDFQNIFVELMKFFVALDVDGFRLDAAKHVTEDFLAQFSVQMRAYAASLGKSNFLVMGEVAAPADWIGRRLTNMFTDPKNPSTHGNIPQSLVTKIFQLQSTYLQSSSASYPGLNAVYDFDQSGTSRDALLGNRPSSDVAKYFDSDYYHTIAGEADALMSWVHLEIHDWDRYLKFQPGNAKGAVVAASFLLTGPGEPIIWQGFELGFNQNCPSKMNAGNANPSIASLCHDGGDDTLKRQDLFADGPWRLGSAIDSINSLSYVGVWTPRETTKDWQNDPMLRRDQPIYRAVRQLIAIRKSCLPLTLGQMVWRDAQDSVGGLLIYSRVGQGQEVVVIINPAPKPVTYTRPIALDGGVNYNRPFKKYYNLLDAFQTASVGYANNAAFLYLPSGFSIDPQSFLIFVYEDNLGSYNSYLGCNLCK